MHGVVRVSGVSGGWLNQRCSRRRFGAAARRRSTRRSMSPKRPRSGESRAYGDDNYWINRFEKSSSNDEETDEWLLSWSQLSPLLDLPPNATVIDLGCGTSSLPIDLLQNIEDARVIAVDIAPGAIKHQRERMRQSDNKVASRLLLSTCDATVPGARLTDAGSASCSIDKSTTDGLLCDTAKGAARVRAMYSNIARELAPTALVVVCSWRDPESDDGLEWLTDLVLGGLADGEEAEALSRWSLDIHTIVSGEVRGPHVYLLQRRPLRRSKRARAPSSETESGVEEDLRVRLHVHET